MKLFHLLFFILVLSIAVSAQVCNTNQTQQCGVTDVGSCKFGLQRCIDGYWGICEGAVYPSSEVCFDELDNDCDSEIDENCECLSGSQRECGTSNKGICKFGTQTCIDNSWSDCINSVNPAISELCGNNLDDDCDSVIDEDCSKILEGTCFDKIKNQDELGIDCGNSCPACPSCFDRIKNQDEEGIDCGGSCNPCGTCFDGIKNQDELGIDCGNSCPACPEREEQDEDKDGLSYAEEKVLGTSPTNPDSDYDGIQDNIDSMPLCPNNFCDSSYSETSLNCPEDCTPEKTFPVGIAAFVFIILILFLVAGIVYFSSHKSKQKPPKDSLSFIEQKLQEVLKKKR
jgi:hypothetical protein